jgi:hypothetical protein
VESEHLRLLDPGIYVKGRDAYSLVQDESASWHELPALRSATQGVFTRLVLFGRVENRSSRLTIPPGSELLIVCEPGRSASEYQIIRGDARDEWREFRVEAALRAGKLLGLGGAEDIALLVQTDKTFDLGVRVRLTSLRAGEYAIVPAEILTAGQVRLASKVYTFAIE